MKSQEELRGASYDLQAAQRIRAMIDLYPSRKIAASVAEKSEDSLANYAAGRNEPPFPVIVRLASHVGVSLHWLATGEGPMREGEQQHQTLATDQVPTPLDDELLAACMKAIDKSLAEVGKFVGYEQRAKMISSLYNDILSATPEELMRDAELEQQRRRAKVGPTAGNPKRRKAS